MFRAVVCCAPLHPVAPKDTELLADPPSHVLLPDNSHYLIKSSARGGSQPQSQPSFSIMYDSWTRNPKWVFEHLSSRHDRPIDESRRQLHFYPEPSIHIPHFQTIPDDYKNSGFDRGHLAPSANHKTSVEGMRTTFTMANACPQDPGFNRGYWLKLEDWVRGLVKRSGDSSDDVDVVVVSGPAYLPSRVAGEWVQLHRIIGRYPRWIQVPTHFYKVVIKASRRKSSVGNRQGAASLIEEYDIAAAAFLLPNKNIDTKIPLESFTVPLNDLEALAGVTFVEAIFPAPAKKHLDDRCSEMSGREGNASMEDTLSRGLLSMYSNNGVFQPSVFAVEKIELAPKAKNISSSSAQKNKRTEYYAEIPMSTISSIFCEHPPIGNDVLKRQTRFSIDPLVQITNLLRRERMKE